MKKLIFFISLLFLLLGCITGSDRWTADKVNMLELGITKDKVIEILGPPTSVSALGETTYLKYMLRERHHKGFQSFYVRFINDKVESFGRTGDFNSTKIPESKTTLDVNIKQK